MHGALAAASHPVRIRGGVRDLIPKPGVFWVGDMVSNGLISVCVSLAQHGSLSQAVGHARTSSSCVIAIVSRREEKPCPTLGFALILGSRASAEATEGRWGQSLLLRKQMQG